MSNDMPHSQITQCPHCQTRFRVSDTQLKAASGTVRCGACFKVFTALAYAELATASPNPESLAAVQTPSQADDTLWIHDDLDLDALDLELAKLEFEQPPEGFIQEPEPPIEPEPMSAPEPVYVAPAAERFRVDDEPLNLTSPSKPSRLKWWIACLVALLVLAGQYLYFNFQTLARQPQTRPALEALCQWVGCEVPAKVDVTQIRSSNLSVREHPQFPGALQVDAIIYNRASFAQPFPVLQMRFSDINGELLASREFRPSEYLSGELAGQSQMPPQTPIRIALEVLDPGQNAVSYSLEFRSP